MQANESDYDFLTRLMRSEGINWLIDEASELLHSAVLLSKHKNFDSSMTIANTKHSNEDRFATTAAVPPNNTTA
jgi:uncharacterized protein involved in type VI secretion and phage assembly